MSPKAQRTPYTINRAMAVMIFGEKSARSPGLPRPRLSGMSSESRSCDIRSNCPPTRSPNDAARASGASGSACVPLAGLCFSMSDGWARAARGALPSPGPGRAAVAACGGCSTGSGGHEDGRPHASPTTGRSAATRRRGRPGGADFSLRRTRGRRASEPGCRDHHPTSQGPGTVGPRPIDHLSADGHAAVPQRRAPRPPRGGLAAERHRCMECLTAVHHAHGPGRAGASCAPGPARAGPPQRVSSGPGRSRTTCRSGCG